MGIIIWLIVGGVVGWLASLIMRTDAQQGLILNIVVGIVGSFIGNYLLGPLFPGSGSIASWPPSIGALVAAFVGAVVLLLLLNLINRGRAR